MALRHDWLGMNFGAYPPYTVETVDKYDTHIDVLWNLGIRKVRNGGSDPTFTSILENSRALSAKLKTKGFNVLRGVTYTTYTTNPITPASWSAYHDLVVAEALYCEQNNNCDIFSIGNEEDAHRGTQTLSSLSRTSNVATANFESEHGYEVGDTVVIAGAIPTDFNDSSGATILSVPSSTSFTYASTGSDGSASGTITAKMTYATLIRLYKETAAACQAVFSGTIIVSITVNAVSAFQTAGITPGTDIDKVGVNCYGGSQTDIDGFKTQIDNAYTAFGENLLITEFNLYFTWSQVTISEKRMEEEMNKRLEILNVYGIDSYFFTWLRPEDEFALYRYEDGTYRDMYNSFFTGRKYFKNT